MKVHRRQFTLILLAAAVGLAWAKTPPRPPLLDYLEGSEFQAENAAQRANFLQGLDDALCLPAAELKKRRYADYQGQAGRWDLATLFRKHLVPSQASRTLGPDFYSDLKDDRVQDNLRSLRKKLHLSSRCLPFESPQSLCHSTPFEYCRFPGSVAK